MAAISCTAKRSHLYLGSASASLQWQVRLKSDGGSEVPLSVRPSPPLVATPYPWCGILRKPIHSETRWAIGPLNLTQRRVGFVYCLITQSTVDAFFQTPGLPVFSWASKDWLLPIPPTSRKLGMRIFLTIS